MADCFNYQCLCRGNESKPPYKCECVACPNRVTESHIIMSNRTLAQEEIKYLTKNGGIWNERKTRTPSALNARIAYAAAIERWAKNQPSRIRFFAVRRWLKEMPRKEDFYEAE